MFILYKMCLRRVLHISCVFAATVLPLSTCFVLTNSAGNNLEKTYSMETMNSDVFEESRKKKGTDKYYMALLLGAVLMKMVLFPLSVKAMAIMSSVSVLLSTMSLIISSMVGYAKLAMHKSAEPMVKYVHVNEPWAKGDEVLKDYNLHGNTKYASQVPVQQLHYSIKKSLEKIESH